MAGKQAGNKLETTCLPERYSVFYSLYIGMKCLKCDLLKHHVTVTQVQKNQKVSEDY